MNDLDRDKALAEIAKLKAEEKEILAKSKIFNVKNIIAIIILIGLSTGWYVTTMLPLQKLKDEYRSEYGRLIELQSSIAKAQFEMRNDSLLNEFSEIISDKEAIQKDYAQLIKEYEALKAKNTVAASKYNKKISAVNLQYNKLESEINILKKKKENIKTDVFLGLDGKPIIWNKSKWE